MRGKAVFAILVTLFMMTPVQAGEVNSFQSQQEDLDNQVLTTRLYTFGQMG